MCHTRSTFSLPGGRQLETAPPTIAVLPRIRAAVGGAATVIFDGGVTRGVDIAKALALGADAVAMGKPYLFGLAAGGSQGVSKAFHILRDELERAMGLLGVGSIKELKERGGSSPGGEMEEEGEGGEGGAGDQGSSLDHQFKAIKEQANDVNIY